MQTKENAKQISIHGKEAKILKLGDFKKEMKRFFEIAGNMKQANCSQKIERNRKLVHLAFPEYPEAVVDALVNYVGPFSCKKEP